MEDAKGVADKEKVIKANRRGNEYPGAYRRMEKRRTGSGIAAKEIGQHLSASIHFADAREKVRERGRANRSIENLPPAGRTNIRIDPVQVVMVIPDVERGPGSEGKQGSGGNPSSRKASLRSHNQQQADQQQYNSPLQKRSGKCPSNRLLHRIYLLHVKTTSASPPDRAEGLRRSSG